MAENPAHPLPRVLIIGRANVGKSSLFNRIVHRRAALVSKTPGTTRDTNWARVDWNQRSFLLGDSAGFEDFGSSVTKKKSSARLVHGTLQTVIERKVLKEIKEAAVRVLVFDGENGITPRDQDIILFLRRKGYPFSLVVNKIDGMHDQDLAADFHALGLPFSMTSAASGIGIGDLLDAVTAILPPPAEDDLIQSRTTIRVALLGKPNVGKSSLLNALAKEERMMTSTEPHTTREPHPFEVVLDSGASITFIDTAGVRRKSRIHDFVEIAGVRMSLKTMEEADIVLLVIDLVDPDTAQDKALARLIVEHRKPCIIIANKYDLLQSQLAALPSASPKDRQALFSLIEVQLRERFPFLKYAPIVPLSALTGNRVHEIAGLVCTITEKMRTHIPADALAAFLARTLKKQPPPIVGEKKRRIQVLSLVQHERRLDQFVLNVRTRDRVPDNFIKFIEKQLRHTFDFSGIPATLTVEKV